MGLVFEWIKNKGVLEVMNANALTKSQLIYKAIESSDGFYTCPVDLKYRSRMNVPFRTGSATGDEALEAEFLKGAEKLAMVKLTSICRWNPCVAVQRRFRACISCRTFFLEDFV
ncbi:hypothetical protein HA402_003676 [Bradysia odoriphaga]|nr:hypothetical protein HA402_003676 [Bradysia odoriphaga]